MPNILVDQLPTAIEIDGQEYAIDSDFRTGLRVILAFEDDSLTIEEKYRVMLGNLYPTQPDNLMKAFELGMRFMDGDKPAEEGEGDNSVRVYSFSHDADLIFAAFKQTHGIDLVDIEYLHWWKFLALFMDLGPETTFCSLVSLRRRVRTGKASKDEVKAYREMNDTLKEPDTRTPDERDKANEFLRLVKGQR